MATRNEAKWGILLVLGLMMGLVIRSDTPWKERGKRKLSAAVLRDLSGRPVKLGSLAGKKATVVVFTGIDCPIGNLYMPRLAELAKTYQPKGVAFIGVNANAHETAEQVAEHAKLYQSVFPIVKDPDNQFADQVEAERTCEVLVFDENDRVQYRGAIDDQYTLDAHRSEPKNTYLANALAEITAGEDVVLASTPVVGCPIEKLDVRSKVSKNPRFRPTAPEILAQLRRENLSEPARGPVNWAEHVAPIMQRRCQGCHRSGQVGRFSLLTYQQARRWAASIAEVVSEGRMPPWHADPRYGHFENDRSLTAPERATLIAWVNQGAHSGDLAKQPAPQAFHEGWTIGEPDVVFAMPEPYVVPNGGTIAIQHFRVPTNFTQDHWVQSAQARPGNAEVVHHIVVYVDDHRAGKHSRERNMQTHLVNFAPGDLPAIYPSGTAKLIPAGSDLIFEVHYTSVGHPKLDKSTVGIIFAKGPITRRAFTIGVAQRQLSIPPGASNYEAHSSYTFAKPVHLLSVMPHMHLRGKDFRCDVVTPSGKKDIFLSVPSYDFGWQSIYRLAEPLDLPAGSRIECDAHFDNSAQNPANPDPTKTVVWGEQTWDEMMIGFVDFAEDLTPADGSLARNRRRLLRTK